MTRSTTTAPRPARRAGRPAGRVRAALTAAALLGSGLAGALLATAPAAQAATVTDCGVGWTPVNSRGLQVDRCGALADVGRPYVFRIETWYVTTETPPFGAHHHVRAVCGSYYYSGGTLFANGCSFTENAY